MPIRALNTFSFDWKIKVRITKKCEKKIWRNTNGEGKLMNIEFIDAEGDQMQATFFKSMVDKFDDIIKETKSIFHL